MKRVMMIVSGCVSLMAGQAFGGVLTFVAASDATLTPALKAEVDFSVSGTNLTVTLKNLGSADVTAANQVLTAVYFDTSAVLTGYSATASSLVAVGGSATAVSGNPSPNGVGGEWAYKTWSTPISGAPITANSIISSSGLGIVGPGDTFTSSSTTNLQGPASPAGAQLGILPTADNLSTGNGSISGDTFAQNSVTFVLHGWTLGDLSPTSTLINNITFQYGTSTDETQLGGANPNLVSAVPEPASLAIWGFLSLVGVTCAFRRKVA